MSLARVLLRSRALHTSARRLAITEFQMPAMSPTMTEGGIAAWKVKEGSHFSAGDVLLEIETDKATMDVEAQDDGVMGKIIVPDGSKNVQVGKVIALLAEEGDDISNLEAPKESSAPSPAPPKEQPKASEKQPTDSGASPSPASQSPPSTPAPQPAHHIDIKSSHPLFPSVIRLLEENNIHDASQIKGTGVRGMLTKGDVLAFLGKASNPFGTFKDEVKAHIAEKPTAQAIPPKETKKDVKPLDGPALRAFLAQGLASLSKPAVLPPVQPKSTFDSIIDDYLPKRPAPLPTLPEIPPVVEQVTVSVVPPVKRRTDDLDGLY